MGQWEKLLEYCDSNLVLVFKTKPVKKIANAPMRRLVMQMKMDSNLHLCLIVFCFTKKEECDHKKKNVQINNVSKYVQFPSK